ncbi:MAG TPA: exopolysaccharide biosynthesis glycosyltransferase EpsD [Polyangiaceae bacterium]|nr:exopolysaccharide biosynthesis glycosyltransferase EpsD [Polyangiaceae bacterium]
MRSALGGQELVMRDESDGKTESNGVSTRASGEDGADLPELSVVVATYNRAALLRDLIDDLEKQTLAPSSFEVLIVDDGSKIPVKPVVQGRPTSFALRVIEQANAGPAAARHRGIVEARADVILIIDDDMRLPPALLQEHLRRHREGHSVVLGHIRAAPRLSEMPLFERFHAQQLDRQVAAFRAGLPARGVHLCTGNVSFRRAAYLEIGGFDRTLARSEDRDLGIRLERAGAQFTFAEDAYTVHESDHTSLEVWLKRAFLYGIYDSRIGAKHGDVPSVSPWRFLFLVHPASRPLLLATAAVPEAGKVAARGLMALCDWLDGRGLEQAALKGTTLVYGIEYFRGMREQAGSLLGVARGLLAYTRKRDAVPRH